jgi:hypothetical protein
MFHMVALYQACIVYMQLPPPQKKIDNSWTAVGGRETT